MPKALRITRITVTGYQFEAHDLALNHLGFDRVYAPGARMVLEESVTTVETSGGFRAEVPGSVDGTTARYLIGRDPLQREIIWHDLKRSQRGVTNAPPGVADVALWDLAGRLYDAPIWQLLGGWRTKLPCYASTYHGDENGGLSTPADYAEFAVRCRDEFGYPAFKIHGWVDGPIARETAAVLAIREAVGDSMDLMLDPAGAYNTFSDVLKVGRACDEAQYFWYEDAFRGGGLSQYGHRNIREHIRTPILMGEHIRGLEVKADMIHARATDYVRANAYTDGGITGVLKLAALAEAHALDVELHGPGLAHRHCMAALRNSNYFELGLVHPKVRNERAEIYEDPKWLDLLESVDTSGCVDVPDGPGLGVDLNWDWINAHKTTQVVYD